MRIKVKYQTVDFYLVKDLMTETESLLADSNNIIITPKNHKSNGKSFFKKSSSHHEKP